MRPERGRSVDMKAKPGLVSGDRVRTHAMNDARQLRR
jgi:hypothetical protein